MIRLRLHICWKHCHISGVTFSIHCTRSNKMSVVFLLVVTMISWLVWFLLSCYTIKLLFPFEIKTVGGGNILLLRKYPAAFLNYLPLILAYIDGSCIQATVIYCGVLTVTVFLITTTFITWNPSLRRIYYF